MALSRLVALICDDLSGSEDCFQNFIFFRSSDFRTLADRHLPRAAFILSCATRLYGISGRRCRGLLQTLVGYDAYISGLVNVAGRHRPRFVLTVCSAPERFWRGHPTPMADRSGLVIIDRGKTIGMSQMIWG